MRAWDRFSMLLSRGLSVGPGSARDAELPPVPDSVIHARLMRTMRRRTSDDLAYLIERVCFRDDWQTASELMTILEGVLEREQAKFNRDQRNDEGLLARLQSLVKSAKARAETTVRQTADGKTEITVAPESIAA